MKKLFVLMAAAFAMVACQTDINEVGVAADGVVAVEFEVGTPQMRAYSDGLTVDDLQYAVYEVKVEGENKTLTHLDKLNGTQPLDGLRTNVQIELANNKKYAVIFWADDENAPYTFKPAEKTVTVDYDNAKCNDESRDAFYAYKEFEVKGAATLGVELRRPFAQVNVGTSDLAAAQSSGFKPVQSSLKVKNVFSTLNLVDGTATNNVAEVTFAADTVPTGETFPVNGHDYLAMSYVLVGKDKGSYDVEYTITAVDNTVINNTIGAVPMQANYRTNIYGKLLTSTTDVNVEIKPGYNEPNNATEAWDGQTIKEPAYDEPTKTYSISCASELAYIAQLVNGTLDTDNVSRAAVAANSLKGCTVKLENNIALNGMEWTPIGNGNKHFMGTFDGNNKTISGLKVTQRRDTRAALFGTVSGTVVFRNLTISGAEVRCPDFKGDFYGSALIGTAYGYVTIENVDVIDSYLSGNNKVGALIAHDGVMNTLTVSGCDVSGTTFEALNAEDGGSVGGLLGYFQTGGEHHITNCSVKGCTFNVVNSTNTGKRANGLLFGGIDSKAGQKLYINDAAIENNTWNEKFYVDGVEVTKGKFISPYGGIIGGERDDKAQGELYIDGELHVLTNYVYTAEQLETALKAGGELILADDIALTKTLPVSNANFTLNGNGCTISQTAECENTYALFDITGGKATIKNVVFDGVKEGAVVRTVGVEFLADGVTAQNGQHTQQQGLFRLLGKSTIKNSIFKNNSCKMVITLNYDGNNNDPQLIENCVFENNTCDATAVVYYVKGAGATINGNKFVGNNVNSNGNGATLYMGFTEGNVITGNLFQNNTVEAGTSKRGSGGLMLGYEAVVSGNAFIGNKVNGTVAKGNDVCASIYYTSIDLSGNYWGGNAPVEDDDYFVEYPDSGNSVIVNDYLTENPIQ